MASGVVGSSFLKFSRNIIIDALFISVLAVYILAGTALTPFHADEATQIYMSHDFAYQFLQGDLNQVIYHDPPISPQEQALRMINGSVNKYLVGLAWHLAGLSVEQLNEQWDWGADYHCNMTTHHAPSQALLMASRIPSAALLATGVLWIFLIGIQLGGRPTAYLASLFYALNPLLLINGRRAMMEGSFIAFTLLAVLAAIGWIKASDNRIWLAALLFGIASGLALSSKHTALFVVIPLFTACFLSALARSIRKNTRQVGILALVSLLLTGVLTALVFYFLNPVWWGDSLARAGEVLAARGQLLSGQTAAFGGYSDIGAAASGFFRQAFIGLAQYFEVAGWENHIGDQIAAYEASPWRGIAIGGSIVGGLILFALTLVGLARLFLKSPTAYGVRMVVLVWVAAALASTLLLTPLEWGRYYLPAIPAVGMLAAYGLAGLAEALTGKLRGRTG